MSTRRIALAFWLVLAAGCADSQVTSAGGVDPQGGLVQYDYCTAADACGWLLIDFDTCVNLDNRKFAECEDEYMAEWACLAMQYEDGECRVPGGPCVDEIVARQECAG